MDLCASPVGSYPLPVHLSVLSLAVLLRACIHVLPQEDLDEESVQEHQPQSEAGFKLAAFLRKCDEQANQAVQEGLFVLPLIFPAARFGTALSVWLT